MASKPLDIIVKVRDAASGGLRTIQGSLKDTGNAVKQASIDFTEFNRTMFSTNAFIGFFRKAFSDFGRTIEEGASFDRLENQFERVLGPSGNLFIALKGFTGTAIDRVEAMKAGIALSSLGVTKDLTSTAEFIARAGDAAKLAGMDAGEGVKAFTAFVKDGSLGHLEFLNLIRSSDPALKAEMSILDKVGGVFGTALTAQEKYNKGMALLRMATRGMNKDNQDLLDVVTNLTQSFKFFRNELGTFIGTSITGLINKVSTLMDQFGLFFQNIKKNDKDLQFLAKSFIYVTGALSGLMAVMGTLRLATIALGSVGIGLPSVVKWAVLLGAAFIGLTGNAEHLEHSLPKPFDALVDRLRVLGGFVRGVWQAISSFIFDPENFTRGIGKIDRSIYDLLEKNNLLEFFLLVVRSSAVVVTTLKSISAQFIDMSNAVNTALSKATFAIMKFLGLGKQGQLKTVVTYDKEGKPVNEEEYQSTTPRWYRDLFNVNSSLQKWLGRFIITMGTFKVVSRLLGVFKTPGASMISGLLSKIPIIGKMFGSKEGPKGTANDPIYVQNLSKLVSSAVGSTFGGIGSLFGSLGAFSDGLLGFASKIPELMALFVVFEAGRGMISSFMNNFQTWEDLFSNSIDWVVSGFKYIKVKLPEIISTLYGSLIDTVNHYVDALGLRTVFDTLKDSINDVIDAFTGLGSGILDIINKVTGVDIKGATKEVTDKFSSDYNSQGLFSAVGNVVSDAFTKFGDMISGAAEVTSDSARSSTLGMNLERYSTTGVIPNAEIPETTQERLSLASEMMKVVDQENHQRAIQIGRAIQATKGKEFTPEEFANAFGLRLETGVIGKSVKTSAMVDQKMANKVEPATKKRGC